MGRLAYTLFELAKTLGWFAATMGFAAASLGMIIGFAWLFQLAFPFLPDFTIIIALLLGFALYLVVVGWIGWQIFKRRMRI